MLLKSICIFLLLNTLSSFSDGTTLSTRNETNLMLAIKSQQSNLREEQDLQRKMINELVKKSDIQELQDRIDKLVKAMDIQSLSADTQSLKAEQERQGKLILNGLVEELNQLQLMMYPTNCTQEKLSGIYYLLLPSYSRIPFKVVCDVDTRDGGWTVILRRMDGSVNFNRKWTEYKKGFGDLRGEFFIGLDKLHALTAERDQELLVLLEDFEGDARFETYDEFAIGGEDEEYELHTLGKASGTAGDSLEVHRGMKFSTFDRENDRRERTNCALSFTGAWWYNDCHHSHLTGTYNDNTEGKGVNWYAFRGWKYSLKKAVMMIRPRK